MTFIPESCRGTCHAATSTWGDPNSGNGQPCTCPARRETAPATTFRESFARHDDPLRSTLLRMGAVFLDLDDPDVYARACRLAHEVDP